MASTACCAGPTLAARAQGSLQAVEGRRLERLAADKLECGPVMPEASLPLSCLRQQSLQRPAHAERECQVDPRRQEPNRVVYEAGELRQQQGPQHEHIDYRQRAQPGAAAQPAPALRPGQEPLGVGPLLAYQPAAQLQVVAEVNQWSKLGDRLLTLRNTPGRGGSAKPRRQGGLAGV